MGIKMVDIFIGYKMDINKRCYRICQGLFLISEFKNENNKSIQHVEENLFSLLHICISQIQRSKSNTL